MTGAGGTEGEANPDGATMETAAEKKFPRALRSMRSGVPR